MPRLCYLRCLLDTHLPISLVHNVEIIIGRNKLTKIKDQACSRQQLSLKANCKECFVEIKQLGVNPSGLDGFALKKDLVYKVKHGSRIEVLLNHHTHIVEFDPPPGDHINTEPQITAKRKLEEDDYANQKRKSLKVDMQELSSQPAMEDVWDDVDKDELYVFTPKGVKASSKIAAFDMDGTLIKTKSGKVHPVDTNDWQIAFPEVPRKLKEYLDKKYKIVILSNQAPIGNGRVKIEDFKKKIEAILAKLNIPIQVYISTGRGFYRKPTTGMWKVLSEQKNDGIKIDMSESFYCGDAAGRIANWAPGKKKDHSMADKLMAENLNLKFYTPEQFFLGHSVANVIMKKPDFIPSEITPNKFDDNLISDKKEILVLVGYPGSGKSFLAKQIEKKSGHKYVAVCRDVLGSWQKCAAEATKLLQQGKSVVVDSTNPDKESRARWTGLAKDMKVECRCAVMLTTKEHAKHNNKFRELMKMNHIPVNEIVFHTYKNKFVEPTPSEGFNEVIQVKFNPFFENEEAEKLYRMHLLEK
ncbi:uncharacterized protein F21D5.5 isoform X2 [Manduca sexta]|nr:uncharacterized protein F21D5.5 isoform X2 [Manduca sexta]XP_037294277.1 uncharacterized protein F21D5.5 isoform X2 [Manduca sexta]KAG6443729.1 hypothetical protein O3G_MSEX003022 [Manduca sexta]